MTKQFLTGEIDFAYSDPTLHIAIARFVREHQVGVMVTNEHGPGGGWPVVKLMGPLDLIVPAVLEGWKSGDDEHDQYVLHTLLAEGEYLP